MLDVLGTVLTNVLYYGLLAGGVLGMSWLCMGQFIRGDLEERTHEREAE